MNAMQWIEIGMPNSEKGLTDIQQSQQCGNVNVAWERERGLALM
jgi:hypothetical protein